MKQYIQKLGVCALMVIAVGTIYDGNEPMENLSTSELIFGGLFMVLAGAFFVSGLHSMWKRE